MIAMTARAMRIGSQPPWTIFVMFAAKKHRLDAADDHHDEDHDPHRPVPDLVGEAEEQHGREDERAGDREAVGAGEGRRAAEPEDEHEYAGEQHPVDHRHVDLAAGVRRGVPDGEPRQEPEVEGLLGDRERPRDHGL